MRVLVTGASGQLGSALVHSAPPRTELRALSRGELNIGDAAAVRAAVADFQPQLIINAAAYTAVDKAESEPELADAINAQAPRHLAEAASAIPGCRLLHISTDYVFNGRGSEPYKPADPTDPLSIYGRTKLAGEHAVLGVLAERAVVLRTAWVYAAQGKNFLLTMLRLMRERGAVRVVADQKGTPTAAASIARALWRIAELPRVHGRGARGARVAGGAAGGRRTFARGTSQGRVRPPAGGWPVPGRAARRRRRGPAFPTLRSRGSATPG